MITEPSTTSPIAISFNMLMETLELPSTQSLFKYEDNYISLTINGTNISSLFKSSVFKAEKTTFSLRPKCELVEGKIASLKDYLDSLKVSFADVKNTLCSNLFFTNNTGRKNYELSLTQDSSSSFTVPQS